MPVNASIYNTIPQAQGLATLGELATMKAQQQGVEQNQQITALKLRQAEREEAADASKAAQQAKLQGIFQRHMGPDGPNQKAILADVYREAPDLAPAIAEHFGKVATDARAARAAELKEQIDLLNFRKGVLEQGKGDLKDALELAATARDENDWQDVMGFVTTHGLQDEWQQRGFRGAFNPAMAQRAAQLTQTEAQRQEAGMKREAAAQSAADREADNRRADAATQQQQSYQNAQLGISRGQLEVARGNLEARKAADAAAGAPGAGGAKLSATAIEKVAGVDQSLGMLDDIDRLFPSMTGYIGPYDGRQAGAQLATGLGVTPELAEFDAQLTGLKNAVIKATTGAAMSEPEAKRIMGQLPDRKLPEAVFKARLATTRRNLEVLKKRTIELSGGSVPDAGVGGLDISTGTAQQGAAPAPRVNPFRK